MKKLRFFHENMSALVQKIQQKNYENITKIVFF